MYNCNANILNVSPAFLTMALLSRKVIWESS